MAKRSPDWRKARKAENGFIWLRLFHEEEALTTWLGSFRFTLAPPHAEAEQGGEGSADQAHREQPDHDAHRVAERAVPDIREEIIARPVGGVQTGRQNDLRPAGPRPPPAPIAKQEIEQREKQADEETDQEGKFQIQDLFVLVGSRTRRLGFWERILNLEFQPYNFPPPSGNSLPSLGKV